MARRNRGFQIPDFSDITSQTAPNRYTTSASMTSHTPASRPARTAERESGLVRTTSTWPRSTSDATRPPVAKSASRMPIQ